MKINIPFPSQSFKNLNLSNPNSSFGTNIKINNKKRQYLSPETILKKNKKNRNQYLSLYPRKNDINNNSVLSMNSDKEILNKSKKLGNTSFSFNNKNKITNKILFNIMKHKKQNHSLNKNKLTLGQTYFFKSRRNSDLIEFPKKKSKTNLKQIQRELQHKLLDMSIQIDNETEQEEDYINQEIEIQRKAKNRFTEYPKININRKNSFKKTKTSAKECVNNNNLIKNEIKFSEESKNEYSIKKNDDKVNNNEKIQRRKSFVPKSSLKNKFEKNNQHIKKVTNLSVNMDLYRELFPNINLSSSGNEITNINNKSMMLTKKKINIKKILLNSLKNEQFENKYRILMRQKELYDSYEDEEIIDQLEEEYLFISPETYQIFIFDTFVLFCTLFSCLYIPIFIAQSKCFCSYIPKFIEYIFLFNDAINIVDIIITFFRAYYNFEFILEKKNKKIVKHYLLSYFFPDLLAAIPFFTMSYFFCNNHKNKPDGEICLYNGVDLKFNFVKVFLGLKIIKLKKVLDKKNNRGINYFYEAISENYNLEKTMEMVLFILICIIGFNFFICYHIYIGFQSYPNWILKTNNHDSSFTTLYIISFYFLVTTITSVGYGDITCVSLSETIYQIIILTIGVIAYSWIVSKIGNYVKKETRAAIKYNKDISLLEEIRISYPKMSFKLYNKIHKHLETVSHQQEKLDTNLLVTNLPYTLKNQIIFIIYGNIIKKFKFFKDCENSDFILRVLTSFIPLSAKQGAFLIQEGDIIDNIVFVREGRLSLVATIDLDNPQSSIDNYLKEKFEDINEKVITKLDNSLSEESVNIGLKKERAKTELKSFLKTKEDIEQENIEKEMAQKDFDREDVEMGNFHYLNILDILKDEHYGIVYMLLKKPAPLSLRVKSKYSQIFLLRKNDTMQISKAYPNVWKKIYYKSYHNMKSIKKLTKKIVINYCINYGLKYVYENNKEVRMQDSNIFFKVGLINSRKRKNPQKISFNLEGNNNSNKYITKSKSILKHKNENNNKSFYGGYQTFKTGNKRLSGSIINANSLQKKKSNTNINQKKISFFTSRNRLSSLGQDDLITKTKINKFNQINNINYNIVINDVDMNNTSKALLKPEENQNHTYIMKKDINKLKKSNLKKINFMQNDSSKLKEIPNLIEFKKNHNLILFNNTSNQNDQSISQKVTFKITNTKENLSKDDTIEIKDTEEKKSEKPPNTINDLSKSLLKKVKKKIIKQRKKKKLYKMILQKLAESFSKINSNLKFNSSLYNGSSLMFSSKIGDAISSNPEMNYVIDEKYELNPNLTQDFPKNELNPNLNTNISKRFQLSQTQEIITFPNPQDLFIIPESLEFSSSESSSEFLSESKSSEENSINKNDYSKNISKSKENISKKKMELSISENNNFTLNSTYENLNIISEGNYSKDENLVKSVMKLIKVYLSEKIKNENEIKNNSSVEQNPFEISPEKKENFKEKEQKKEKDVWSFLEEDNKDNSSLDQKDKDSLEKDHCKSPQIKQKKTIDRPKNKKSRKNYDNLFSLDDTPKNKKTFKKRKSRKIINKTTLKSDIKRKKSKKMKSLNSPILKLNSPEKERSNNNYNYNEKDENKNEIKQNTMSSLDLDHLNDEMDPKRTYNNNNFKTYQSKSNKNEKIKNIEKDDKNHLDNFDKNNINSKDDNNYG